MRRQVLILAILTSLGVARGHADDDAPATTFSRDVAPILHDRCASCHRPGEIGPMALLTYEQARPYAKAIKKSVMERTMPPWHADSTKVEYRDDISLTDAQIQTIARWVDSGAALGNPDETPKPPVFTDGWAMGEPDLIFHATKDVVIKPNQDHIAYRGLPFDTSALTEDIYISEWEIRTTERAVVHHANLNILPKPFELNAEGTAANVPSLSGGTYLGGYIPGSRPMRYPEGTAFLLPKGSHFGMEIHFVSLDHEVTPHLMVGVRLAQGRVDKIVQMIFLLGVDKGLDIQPHQSDYALAADLGLPYDTILWSTGAHMHLRGSAYRMEAVLPTGERKLLADVPRYDFNWQSTYWLAKPILAPKGSSLRTIAHWDNSSRNPNVDHPEQRVKNGPWTEDEMLNTWAHASLADQKLGLNIKDGRVVGKFEDAVEGPRPPLLQAMFPKILSKDGKYDESPDAATATQ